MLMEFTKERTFGVVFQGFERDGAFLSPFRQLY